MNATSCSYFVLLCLPILGGLFGYFGAKHGFFEYLGAVTFSNQDANQGGDPEDYPVSDFDFYPTESEMDSTEFPDKDILSSVFEESKEQLQFHLDEIDQAGDRAENLIRLNATFVAVIIAVIRLGQPQISLSLSNPGVWPLYLGLIYLIGGVVYLLSTRESVDVTTGLGENDIDVVLEGKFTKPFYYEWIMKTGYKNWIPEARKLSESQHTRVNQLYILTTMGIILTIAGVILSVF